MKQTAGHMRNICDCHHERSDICCNKTRIYEIYIIQRCQFHQVLNLQLVNYCNNFHSLLFVFHFVSYF